MKKETGLFIFLFILWVLVMLSCNPIQKAENRVLADVESVKRVRAKTDALWPCANDSLVFIHDSTTVTETVFERDTLIESRNDTTFVNYFDTVTVTKTLTKTVNTIVTDNREVNKLKDSLTAIRLREAKFSGQILSKDNDVKKAKSDKQLWFIIAIFAIAILIIIGVLTVYKALTNILPIRK